MKINNIPKAKNSFCSYSTMTIFRIHKSEACFSKVEKGVFADAWPKVLRHQVHLMPWTILLRTPIPCYKLHPVAKGKGQICAVLFTDLNLRKILSCNYKITKPKVISQHTEGFCRSMSKQLMAHGSTRSSMGSSPINNKIQWN